MANERRMMRWVQRWERRNECALAGSVLGVANSLAGLVIQYIVDHVAPLLWGRAGLIVLWQ